MKGVRYTKYNGDLASEIDLEGLLDALSDYFLDSGFRDPYADYQGYADNLDDLREALRNLLESGELFDDEIQKQIAQMSAEGKLDELIDKLIQRLEEQNYISSSESQDPSTGAGGQIGEGESEVRFEVTDKSLDFLGLQDAARSAWLAGQIKLRAPRYPPLGNGHRGQWRAPAL